MTLKSKKKAFKLNHNNVSAVKSILRVFAGFALTQQDYLSAGLLFIVAEMLGILEEIV